ncbi:MAG TPA: hypothetical protein VKT22_10990 [Steroidobacteraceae bacterium]|nr:hypothetical protein [Steroidobacteraceae bacterium]
MSDPAHKDKVLPVENYRPALARAVEWLGDRYLLAKPINAEVQRKQKPASPSSTPAEATQAASEDKTP